MCGAVTFLPLGDSETRVDQDRKRVGRQTALDITGLLYSSLSQTCCIYLNSIWLEFRRINPPHLKNVKLLRAVLKQISMESIKPSPQIFGGSPKIGQGVLCLSHSEPCRAIKDIEAGHPPPMLWRTRQVPEESPPSYSAPSPVFLSVFIFC